MIKKLLLSLIAILCLTTLKSNLSSADTMTISPQQYQHMITNSDLIAITDKALVSKSQQSEATIFIGRPTCHFWIVLSIKKEEITISINLNTLIILSIR